MILKSWMIRMGMPHHIMAYLRDVPSHGFTVAHFNIHYNTPHGATRHVKVPRRTATLRAVPLRVAPRRIAPRRATRRRALQENLLSGHGSRG